MSDVPHEFAGTVPLFPLPDCVLFPRVLLPLHIFEPRYRQMTRDALDGDRLIAMALLSSAKPGMQAVPAVHSIVGLGRIETDEKMPDGRYLILLKGLSRARIIVEEDRPDLPYRLAELQIVEDQPGQVPEAEQDLLRHELLLRYRKAFPQVDMNAELLPVLSPETPLGVCCDILAHTLHQDAELTYLLLAENDVGIRARMLLEQLDAHIHSSRRGTIDRDFPPPFSSN